MATCPKCLNKLTKRRSDNTYNCRRHGFVRDVLSDRFIPAVLLRKHEPAVLLRKHVNVDVAGNLRKITE